MSSAFEQAKLLKDQSRLPDLGEQVQSELFRFHGESGISYHRNDESMWLTKGDERVAVVTVTGRTIHIKAGPTSITCYYMEAFSRELANVMVRHL
jgi:hypothetical protein